jgi:hypothetical protein
MNTTITATNLPAPSVSDSLPDKRNTMPKGGYRFGASNAALRPEVPKGQ